MTFVGGGCRESLSPKKSGRGMSYKSLYNVVTRRIRYRRVVRRRVDHGRL
jgi:hypothetical protein